MNYAGLKAEIAKAAYNGMTDAAIAAAIDSNTVTTVINPLVLRGSDIFNAIVPSEFTALSAANQQLVAWVFGLGDAIDVSAGTNARLVLQDNFPSNSGTWANLVKLATVTQTIAASLGFPTVTDQDVLAARKYS